MLTAYHGNQKIGLKRKYYKAKTQYFENTLAVFVAGVKVFVTWLLLVLLLLLLVITDTV